MPRIRTLKPEHKQHRKVGRLDHLSYRLWVGMITEADDEGRLVCEPEQLRVLIFGYLTEVTDALIEDSLRIVENSGLIHRYQVDSVTYAFFRDWREHQRINRPTPSKLPPPPKDSLSPHGAFMEDSRRIGREGKGSRIGREGTGEGAGDGSPAPPLSHSAPTDNGIGPDGWPLEREARKQAMLKAAGIVKPAETPF